MDMIQVKEKFETLKEHLLSLAEFNIFMEDPCHWNNLLFALEDNYNYNTARGMTKMVIWDDDCQCVFKMDINDYRLTEKEVEYYIAAQNEGLEDAFCQVVEIGTIVNPENEEEFPVYAAEFAECDEYSISNEAYSVIRQNYIDGGMDEDEAEESASDECYSPDGVGELLRDKLEVDGDKFSSFCARNHINDIHAGNVGYIGERMCVIDYSGI